MRSLLFLLLLLTANMRLAYAQVDSIKVAYNVDSVNVDILSRYKSKIGEVEKQRQSDSVVRKRLEEQLAALKTTDNLKKEQIQQELEELKRKEIDRKLYKKAQIDSLRVMATGYPVMGLLKDTLFVIYTRLASYTAHERAENISLRIKKLYDDDFLKIDSLFVVKADNYYDIMYKDRVVMSVSETDALWHNTTLPQLAGQYAGIIKESIVKAREERSVSKFLIRIAWVLLALLAVSVMIYVVNKLYKLFIAHVNKRNKQWLKKLSYKDYTFLSAEQELRIILFLIRGLRLLVIALLLYLVIPIVFSIFPFTRGWADELFGLIWRPLRTTLMAIWEYLPNVFTILVIYFVVKYVIRFVKYIFTEIEQGKLKIQGFHADWAPSTYSIIRFLLYAFMFVLIFPYLPGSNSNIFKGVSVFIGVLFSLGSSSAIANMVAGLVITYMRPFKIGDKIKIGDISGTVVEKTLLVTRLKTATNEQITIPNSTVLSVNTVNYNSYAKNDGLIVHTTVTIGYDVPWRKIDEALVEAALRSKYTLPSPRPFVLQPSLGDFFVSYELHAYTREANAQAEVYSELHRHIQDVCNERGIEIMSPHYHAIRDGGATTIPDDYLPTGHINEPFNINIGRKEDSGIK